MIMLSQGRCRFCGEKLETTLVDLGMSPLCESYLEPSQLNDMEPFYPLHVFVCQSCLLVQLDEYVDPEHIFSEYAYFSSFSDTWLRHAEDYVAMMIDRFALGSDSRIVELASNDGYLLQYFVHAGIPVLGVEPAKNIAKVAIDKGIDTMTEFFGKDLARTLASEGKMADVLLGNNVLAQIPDINDFVGGMQLLLKETGVITMEFPHLVCLMKENQFDTIYHEHFSYFSLIAVSKIFAAHGLTIFDVEKLSTHGGSLRIFACHDGNVAYPISAAVADLMAEEESFGLVDFSAYSTFAEQVRTSKRKILKFLINEKEKGKVIVGYGAPGKGNTLLNYCGIRTDFVDYTVDRNPYKQGKFLPGTHIPICGPDMIMETKPDFVLILPWNFKDEIIEQISYIREWGGRFVVPIPEVRVIP
ncbi:methyltransferase domain-containing protein [Gemmatimonadota bacterium]